MRQSPEPPLTGLWNTITFRNEDEFTGICSNITIFDFLQLRLPQSEPSNLWTKAQSAANADSDGASVPAAAAKTAFRAQFFAFRQVLVSRRLA
jgi:hypothetical protein